jgi:hypothetical protein
MLPVVDTPFLLGSGTVPVLQSQQFCAFTQLPPSREDSLKIESVYTTQEGRLYSTELSQNQSQSYITTDSQSASPSWCQAPIWTLDQYFPFSLWLFLDTCGFVGVWWEVGSVVFSFCQALPAQPFSDLSPTGLMSIFYCLYFWDSPKPEGPGSCIYFPQEQDSPVIPPGIGFV